MSKAMFSMCACGGDFFYVRDLGRGKMRRYEIPSPYGPTKAVLRRTGVPAEEIRIRR